MNKIQHPSNNLVLGAPPGMSIDECSALAVTRVQYKDGSIALRSYWKPSREELALLNKGFNVCLEILSESHPPVILSVE